VTSVFEGSQPEKQGIFVGDEIVSINGTKISELPAGAFCQIYRNDYELISKKDTMIYIELIKNGEIRKYSFDRQYVFEK
jgi:C-terminal processing protease CtpA/Prc